MQFPLQKSIPLAPLTTIGLGGAAEFFSECETVEHVCAGLEFSKRERLSVQIFGGGSNVIFSDAGFPGLVVKIAVRGIHFEHDGEWMIVRAAAGEVWDHLVHVCIEKGLAGIECLSGIPGLVGGTPIQNVGAYGQEVKDTIVEVRVLERETLREKILKNAECGFSYRASRFKTQDSGKFIVTEVSFRLKKEGRPTVRYPEVKKIVETAVPLSSLADGRASLEAVRSVVLSLRKKKSMLIDPNDPNSKSVGSFFLNPVIEQKQFSIMSERWKKIGDGSEVPAFPSEDKVKLSAAWLVEHSGLTKGYRKGGAGISSNHSLAIINCGGTTRDVLALASEIEERVFGKFGIRLVREAVVVG
ncbi:MAG: UDP-N-acetylmuramate dehydrogenase [Bacteroidota bacterium]|nr:UDP-N-acetylmuramate dehydrogenase [Bacteroidota bacterium]